MDKDDLVASAALLSLELKIEHGPAALVFRQVCKKIVVLARRLLFNWHDFRLLIIETEDDVLVLLLEFQVLIHCQTIWVYTYAGRLVLKHYIGIYWMTEQKLVSHHCSVLVVGYGSEGGGDGGCTVRVSRWQCPRQSPTLDNQSAILGASTRIHCPAMHHSHIRSLLRHSGLRASPHAGNLQHQRVCVLGANPAPSRTAAGAQCIRVSDHAAHAES